jgi:Na+/H+ antiporter NhaD/arsenite permease-like protein
MSELGQDSTESKELLSKIKWLMLLRLLFATFLLVATVFVQARAYLTFFNSALGKFYSGMTEAQAVPLLMSENAIYLEAVAAGAVFFGACSYIGNAPNFMVRSISEEAGTPMPSFFGYILKYSLVYLVPTFVIVTLIFF